jgi:hypothetical protein
VVVRSFSLARPALLAGLALALLTSSTPLLVNQDVSAKRGAARHGVGQERKAKRAKTVTKSFTQGTAMVIPTGQQPGGVPADPYPSTLEVRGFNRGKIVDLDVTLHGFEHEIPLDVDILLVKEGAGSPAVQILGDVGDVSHDDVAFITLDDEADEDLPYFDELTPGRFRPTDHDQDGNDDDSFPAPAPAIGPDGSLSAFDGLNPNGTWRLYVVDARNDDGGGLDGWELTFEVKEKGRKKR